MKPSSAFAVAFATGLISLACILDLAYLAITLGSRAAESAFEPYSSSGALAVGGAALVGLVVFLPVTAVFAVIAAVGSRHHPSR